MQTMLSVLISAWFGIAIGAAVDESVPVFWETWFVIGLIIVCVTSIYVHDRRFRRFRDPLP